MAVQKKTKKRKRRKLTPIVKFVCLILIGVSCAMLFSVGKEVITTISLQKQLTEVQARLQEVEDENEYLNSEKEKLKDPDYVENYARGKFMLSKEGEQIFHLPEAAE